VNRIAVGIDHSLTSTGIAWPGGCTSVKSDSQTEPTVSDWAWRLIEIADQVIWQVTALDPQFVVMESPAFGLFSSNKSESQHERAGLYWILVTRLKDLGVTLYTATSGQVKNVLNGPGKGRADKKTQLASARRWFPSERIANDDEADAKALCAIGMRWLGVSLGDIPPEFLATAPAAPWEPKKAKKVPSKPPKPRNTPKKPRISKKLSKTAPVESEDLKGGLLW